LALPVCSTRRAGSPSQRIGNRCCVETSSLRVTYPPPCRAGVALMERLLVHSL
jgi:hypothetical protein